MAVSGKYLYCADKKFAVYKFPDFLPFPDKSSALYSVFLGSNSRRSSIKCYHGQHSIDSIASYDILSKNENCLTD